MLLQTLAQATIDRTVLGDIRHTGLQLVDTASERIVTALADVAEVLTPERFTNFDAFARRWSHHAYAKEDWWHRERLFKPDYIIMQWRMVVARHARGIQTYGNWAPVEKDA